MVADTLKKTVQCTYRGQLWIRRRPWLAYALLLAAGLLAAIFLLTEEKYSVILELDAGSPQHVYMDSRLFRLDSAMQTLEDVGFVDMSTMTRDHCMPYYLFAAYLGKLLGLAQATSVFLVIQLGALCFMLLMYPVLIFRISRSFLLSMASPFLLPLLVPQLFIPTGIDWAMPWIVVLGIPILFSLFANRKNWGKADWGWFFALCVLLGLSGLPRNNSGIVVFFVLLFISANRLFHMFKARGKGSRILIQAGLTLLLPFVAYFLFVTIIPAIYAAATGQPRIESMGPWHTLYIGLGWTEDAQSAFGIMFADESGVAKVQEVNPAVVYNSREYMDILRSEWFAVFREHPWEFLWFYLRKAVSCLHLAAHYFVNIHGPQWSLIILLEAVTLRLSLPKLALAKRYLPFIVISLVVLLGGLVFPMMAVPFPSARYGWSSAAAVGLVVFGGLLAVYAEFIAAVRKRFGVQQQLPA